LQLLYAYCAAVVERIARPHTYSEDGGQEIH